MRFLAHQVSKLTKSILNLPSISAKRLPKRATTLFSVRENTVLWAHLPEAHTAQVATQSELHPNFFIDVGVVFDKCSELIVTDTMRERKGIMEDKADAFVICAGGMGTFEEFFEVLTLKQLNRHTKPIIIYNVKGYYNSMLAMLDNAVSEKFMTNACNRLYTIADTEEEVFNQLENYVPFTYNKYEFLKKDGEQNG